MSGREKALVRAAALLAEPDPRAVAGRLEANGSGRALVAAWVRGVVRRRRTLRVVLGNVARRALKGRSRELAAALELGAFLLLLGDDPPEGPTELAALAPGKKGREHAARVLDALADAIADRSAPPAPGDDRTLPVDRARAVRFKRPLLDVEGRKPAARLGILHGYPDALVAAWIAAHGEETAAELCRAGNDAPPLFGRVQPLRTNRAELLAALAAEGLAAEPAELEHAFAITERRGFRETGPWRDGWFSIQDLTAQRAAPLLDPRPGEAVLDLCAAPGTKTAALAEQSGDAACVLACDLAPRRLRKVAEGAARLGLGSIATRALDGRRAADLLRADGPFDAVLVDAPCSNTGVLRRRPEARWRYDARGQRRLCRTQADLLAAGLDLLRPGGRLVYSVCSIEPEEGAEQVAAARATRPGLALAAEATHLPAPGGGDGGYLALLRPV